MQVVQNDCKYYVTFQIILTVLSNFFYYYLIKTFTICALRHNKQITYTYKYALIEKQRNIDFVRGEMASDDKTLRDFFDLKNIYHINYFNVLIFSGVFTGEFISHR